MTKTVRFKRRTGEFVSITPGKKKEPKRLSALKGSIVEFEIDERPYHATGTIIGKNSFHPNNRVTYKVLVIYSEMRGNKGGTVYDLDRDDFNVVG
jgi:hypothetical protein